MTIGFLAGKGISRGGAGSRAGGLRASGGGGLEPIGLGPGLDKRAAEGDPVSDGLAYLDRLLHHCDVISINGPSYRLKNRLKAIERDTDVA